MTGNHFSSVVWSVMSALVAVAPCGAAYGDTVVVPAGGFWMGRDDPADAHDDEVGMHWVDVPAFEISRNEITNAEYAAFLNAVGVIADEYGRPYIDVDDPQIRIHHNGSSWQADTGWEDHPMREVSWFGAEAYCRWAGGRLPTEEEWEKAARGDDGRTWPWGNSFSCSLNSSWWCNAPYDTGITTYPVGSFPGGASPYGALDMAGNVWEWTMGGYSSYPGVPPAVGEFEDFTREVQRGGSWTNSDYNLRCATRSPQPRYITDANLGFRVCYSEYEPDVPPIVPPSGSSEFEWVEDFDVATGMDEIYNWWGNGRSFQIDAGNSWLVASLEDPSYVCGEYMAMIRRDTGGLFSPGDLVDITVQLKYERGDRGYARTSVGVAWGDTRMIIPGGRGADENFGYPWFLIANNSDNPNQWHQVAARQIRWGEGKFCIGFGLWGNLSDKANPPIVGQHRMWVDWIGVRHAGDTDGDGILDDGDGSGTAGDNPCTSGQTENCDDNCPMTANPDQLDDDGDGVGDVCDMCPGFDDTQDADIDGVPDACDNCPGDANADQTDTDQDGAGDACDVDDDNDGIDDALDNCPLVANPNQANGDTDAPGDVCDNCPLAHNPGQEDADDDGIGDVCDSCDNNGGGGVALREIFSFENGTDGFVLNTTAYCGDGGPGMVVRDATGGSSDGTWHVLAPGKVRGDCDDASTFVEIASRTIDTTGWTDIYAEFDLKFEVFGEFENLDWFEFQVVSGGSTTTVISLNRDDVPAGNQTGWNTYQTAAFPASAENGSAEIRLTGLTSYPDESYRIDNIRIYAYQPAPDDDGDGVRNECDLCPDTLSGASVDGHGCPAVPADLDLDGDVDEEDLVLFRACLSGAAIPPDDPGCHVADLDHDDDVDQSDFGVFQRCLSGPDQPADSACAD